MTARAEAPYTGKRFKVLKPNMFFPHDFEVIEETITLIRLRNDVETYWLTHIRFTASLADGIFQERS